MDELIAQRDTLHRLATGDRAMLPDRVLAKLTRWPPNSASPRTKCAWPGGFDDHISRVKRGPDDPRYLSLIRRMSRAVEWEPEDHRVDELATAWADHYLAHPSLLPVPAALQDRTDGAIRHSLIAHAMERSRSRPELAERVG
ncbi:hypothetical protein [Nonomuraea jabiensis]|uniref:Uncharacterized protein n=1 Tax=Nonomuraea jabiensis TaxID=882448 RepID=A0A7W9GC24_9ACTN|nr:hypothetical protein [Nonomuraea jabiensis]MBB5781020.1 hypothetical protein [Nonomuraea jabiensis]